MAEVFSSIIITGATGFVGTYLLEALKDDYKIYAISRRKPEHSVFKHENVKWIQCDIAIEKSVELAFEQIRKETQIDFVFHLAGYYDFNYDNNPEYYRTNVLGTKHILEFTKTLNIKRFVFASSVAACEFPRENNEPMSEQTPADAEFEYAKTKRKGEELTKEYSKYFHCSVVRFAAVFSDWCEYGPFYVFLNTWFSRSWKSRVLGGEGISAITYIHTNCLNQMLKLIMINSDYLPKYDTYIASAEDSVTHNELFKMGTNYFYGVQKKPIHMPKLISYFGVMLLNILGRLTGNIPFEKPWMMRYVDRQLKVDNSYTKSTLNWAPAKRFRIQRRLLFMIEHMKSYPYEWQKRNSKALKAIPVTPNFKIYETLDKIRDEVIDKIMGSLLKIENLSKFGTYHSIKNEVLRKDIITIYQFLSVSVRTKDRMSMLTYARELAKTRLKQEFKQEELLSAVELIGDTIKESLINHPRLKGMEKQIYDEVTFSFQLMMDEIEGTFEAYVNTIA